MTNGPSNARRDSSRKTDLQQSVLKAEEELHNEAMIAAAAKYRKSVKTTSRLRAELDAQEEETLAAQLEGQRRARELEERVRALEAEKVGLGG